MRALVARFACASVLLVAAALKSYEPVGELAEGGVLHSQPALLLIVEFELILGGWLLSGALPAWCRRVALLTFAIFGLYSAYSGLSAMSSCGCFGRLQTSPWISAGLDSVCVLLLWLWKPTRRAVERGRADLSTISVRFATVLLLGGVVVPLVSMLGGRQADARVSGLGFEQTSAVLKPDTWLGRRLPIIGHVEIGENLAEGSWAVMLFRHDCPKCHEALRQYEQLAEEHEADVDGLQVALIEVPPFGTSPAAHQSRCAYGRLSDDKEWYVSTPTEIRLINGVVVEVR